MKSKQLHAVIFKENNLYVAKLLEIELASQGKTRDEAFQNLKEAFELYIEDEGLENTSFPSIENLSTQSFTIN